MTRRLLEAKYKVECAGRGDEMYACALTPSSLNDKL